MDSTQIEKLTECFLADLRSDPLLVDDMLRYAIVTSLRANYETVYADVKHRCHRKSAVDTAVAHTLQERGWSYEDIRDAMRVSEKWLKSKKILPEPYVTWEAQTFDNPLDFHGSPLVTV